MLRYIGQRLIALVITLFIIVSLFFIISRLQPGGPFSGAGGMNPDMRARLIKKYNLDKPVIQQYTKYVADMFKGDFGESIKVKPGVPVFNIIKEKLPITMLINVLSTLIILPVGVFFGTVAALRKNTWIDHLVQFFVVLMISMPSFVIAALMQYFLAFKLGWFPTKLSNDVTLNLTKMHSLVLPILASTFGGVATITRFMRSELGEQMNSDYMLLAKTKGLTRVQALFRHALRNAFIPLLPIFLSYVIFIFGGSIVIESIFSIPGMGTTNIEAINTMDYALSNAINAVFTTISLFFTLLIDLLYGVVDPRIRMGGKK